MSPADELREAARLMRERAQAATSADLGLRPWAVTECSDKAARQCPCIVYQGEYMPYDEPQVPLIQYVCDAEDKAFAAHIAGMHPGVALAFAKWLEVKAANPGDHDHGYALAAARAYTHALLKNSRPGRAHPRRPPEGEHRHRGGWPLAYRLPESPLGPDSATVRSRASLVISITQSGAGVCPRRALGKSSCWTVVWPPSTQLPLTVTHLIVLACTPPITVTVIA